MRSIRNPEARFRDWKLLSELYDASYNFGNALSEMEQNYYWLSISNRKRIAAQDMCGDISNNEVYQPVALLALEASDISTDARRAHKLSIKRSDIDLQADAYARKGRGSIVPAS